MEGVWQKALKIIPDERGKLMEFLRSDDDIFRKFGQVYITTVFPGVVKGWHAHQEQRDYLGCVWGMIKLVLYDGRDNSPTQGKFQEYFIGEQNPLLLSIPPGVWHGFKGIGTKEAIIINCPTLPYDYLEPDELRIAPHGGKIKYDWDRQDG